MSVNSDIQTGPNTQLGGVNHGIERVAYHVGMDWLVKIEPIIPAIWHIMMLTASFRILFTIIYGNSLIGYSAYQV